MNFTTVENQKIDVYTRKNSAKQLGLTVNQFNYLVSRIGIEPFIRTGSKHAVVLYSKEQIRELKLISKMLKLKLPHDVIDEILNLTKNTDYKEVVWVITFEDIISKPIVCLDENLLAVTGQLKDSNTAISIRKINIPD